MKGTRFQLQSQLSSVVEQRFCNSEWGFPFNFTSMDSMEFETASKGRNRCRNFQRVPSSASNKPQKHPYRIQKRDTTRSRAELRWWTVSGAAKFQNPGCNGIQRSETQSGLCSQIPPSGLNGTGGEKDSVRTNYFETSFQRRCLSM